MKIITLMLILMLSPISQAADWRHIRATTTDGTQVAIDYVLNINMDNSMKPVNTITAWPVFVNITGGLTNADSKVQIVIPHRIGATKILYKLDLLLIDGTHFSGNLINAKREFLNGTAPFEDVTVKTWGYYYNGQLSSETQIAINVDGNWLDFPDQGHNLKFNFLNGEAF